MELNPKFSSRAKDDFLLIQKAVDTRDQQAFKEIMNRYHDSIFYMCLKMVHNREDSEDLTLETFSKAFKNLGKYDPQFAFSTWLFKIATNACIDFLRKKRLETMPLEINPENDENSSLPINIEADSPTPEQKMMKQQRAVSVRLHIEKLPEKYRQLIELRYYEELSYDEIAQQLDIPLGTVKAQLFRAKELLSQLIEGQKDHI